MLSRWRYRGNQGVDRIRLACKPSLLPDLADSLDGHLTEAGLQPLDLRRHLRCRAPAPWERRTPRLWSADRSRAAADLLLRSHGRAGVTDSIICWVSKRWDALVEALHRDQRKSRSSAHRTATSPAPGRHGGHPLHDRPDAIRDCGRSRFAPWFQLSSSRRWGAEVVAAVAPAHGPALESVPAGEVIIGDLQGLRKTSAGNDCRDT